MALYRINVIGIVGARKAFELAASCKAEAEEAAIMIGDQLRTPDWDIDPTDIPQDIRVTKIKELTPTETKVVTRRMIKEALLRKKQTQPKRKNAQVPTDRPAEAVASTD